ncbi:MAG: hypothetical protein AAGD35_01510 [Actinomycetota bacterium]
MGLIKKLFVRPSGRLGLLSDAVMVGTAASRVAGRRGTTASGAGSRPAMGPGEMALTGAAALRLLQRLRRARKRRKLRKAGAYVADAAVDG